MKPAERGVTKEDLDEAIAGTMVEDCDEDVWVKDPSGSWSIVRENGEPSRFPGGSRFVSEFAPLKLLGVSEKAKASAEQKAEEPGAKVVMPEEVPLPDDFTVTLPGKVLLPGPVPGAVCGAFDFGYQLDPHGEATRYEVPASPYGLVDRSAFQEEDGTGVAEDLNALCAVCGEEIWYASAPKVWLHTRRDENGHDHEASPKTAEQQQ